MKEARESLGRIDDWLERLRKVAGDKKGNTKIECTRSRIEDALDDDLNISAALGFLFETIRETNRAMDENNLDMKTAAGWLNWWNRTNQVLDFESDETALPEDVAKLAEARVQARLAKDFRKSDELRDK